MASLLDPNWKQKIDDLRTVLQGIGIPHLLDLLDAYAAKVAAAAEFIEHCAECAKDASLLVSAYARACKDWVEVGKEIPDNLKNLDEVKKRLESCLNLIGGKAFLGQNISPEQIKQAANALKSSMYDGQGNARYWPPEKVVLPGVNVIVKTMETCDEKNCEAGLELYKPRPIGELIEKGLGYLFRAIHGQSMLSGMPELILPEDSKAALLELLFNAENSSRSQGTPYLIHDSSRGLC
jgi:hypothetical protein